jgi:cytosine/adenosine deaminase-related metal-dependent hydrolase
VTCVGDISRTGLAWPVLKRICIRKVCFIELLSIASEPPRDIGELQRLLAAVDEDDRLLAGISPHAPYTVHADAFRDAVRLAKSLRRPWTTHWSETAEEVRWLKGDEGAIPTPLSRFMAEAGLRSPRANPCELLRASAGEAGGLLAHANYCSIDDIDALAKEQRTVVYCPRAHRFFGHPPHAWRQMRERGVSVVLGTDSLASNESLSILDEVRFLRALEPAALSAAEWVKMITLDAARALGLGRQIGALTRGSWADLAAFSVTGVDDPCEQVLQSVAPSLGVWVGGERVI